jgi:hypothetical protein
MHLLFLAALAVDQAADPPVMTAAEKAAAEKLKANAGFIYHWPQDAPTPAGPGPLRAPAGHFAEVIRSAGPQRFDARSAVTPADLAPLRDMPWLHRVKVSLTELDTEAAWNLAGPRRYGAPDGCLDVENPPEAPCVVSPGALAYFGKLRPETRQVNLRNVVLPAGALDELASFPRLQSLWLRDVPLDDNQLKALLRPGAFPSLTILYVHGCGVGNGVGPDENKVVKEFRRRSPRSRTISVGDK